MTLESFLDHVYAVYGLAALYALIVAPGIAFGILACTLSLVLAPIANREGARALQARSAGRFDEAERRLCRLLVTARLMSFGARGLVWAGAMLDLALLRQAQKRLEDATALVRRALVVIRKHGRAGRKLEIHAYAILGELAILGDRTEEAEAHFSRSVELAGAEGGPRNPLVAASLLHLGQIGFRGGRWDDAAKFLEQGIQALETTLGSKHEIVVDARATLARLASLRGHDADAEALFRRVLADKEETLGPEHPGLARPIRMLAAFLHERGRADESADLISRAVALEARADAS